MSAKYVVAGSAILICCGVAGGRPAQQSASHKNGPDPPASNNRETNGTNEKSNAANRSAERGRYIVHHVAMCIYCHTPRQEDGTLVRQQLLRGAPFPLPSPFAGQEWAFKAPSIAGLPGGWTEADMIRFLQTRKTPTGRTPQPPMPPFQMTEADARDVAAYLKSFDDPTSVHGSIPLQQRPSANHRMVQPYATGVAARR